ncbi:MAG: hypothetical protein ACTS4W_00460 [Candidatus Hodgkinia cicadicola]
MYKLVWRAIYIWNSTIDLSYVPIEHGTQSTLWYRRTKCSGKQKLFECSSRNGWAFNKITFKSLPIRGTTSTKLLDTTPAQYAIRSHGKTLPRININAKVPITHVPPFRKNMMCDMFSNDYKYITTNDKGCSDVMKWLEWPSEFVWTRHSV